MIVAFLVTPSARSILGHAWLGFRWAFFAAVLGARSGVPLALHRWVWRHRRLERTGPAADAVASAHRGPTSRRDRAGPGTTMEQACPPASVRRPSSQTAEDAAKRDFRDAVPNPRHRLCAGLAAADRPGCAWALLAFFPAAALNACKRRAPPRGRLSSSAITSPRSTGCRTAWPVAHGEPFSITTRSTPMPSGNPASWDGPAWPAERRSSPVLRDGRYSFESAAADRALLAEPPHRGRPPADPGRADVASRVDPGQRLTCHSPRTLGLPKARAMATCGAAPSRS